MLEAATREELKGIRGLKVIAVLLIFWWHCNGPKPSIDLGARGCEFLFVCSGFLISYNYADRMMPSTWDASFNYTAKKIVKMWPLHVITLIVAIIIEIQARGINLIVSVNALFNFLCLQSWTNAPMSFNGVSWFLSSLLFCYFMTPVLLRMQKKRPFVLFCIILCVRLGLEYISYYYATEVLYMHVHCHPVMRCLEFFMGMLTGLLFLEDEGRNKISIFQATLFEICSIAVMLIPAICFEDALYRGGYVLFFCIAVYMFSFDKGVIAKVFNNGLLVFLSGIQCEFFLIHTIVIVVADIVIKNNELSTEWQALVGIEFFITIILAWLYKRFLKELMERLTTRLLNRIAVGITGKNIL